jgi:hypothetical protein
MLLMTQAITVGMKTYSYTVKQYSSDFQNDCLQNKPDGHTNAECQDFLRSDKATGTRLAWASFFSLSADPKYFQYISTIQDDNLCCGFGPPLRCYNDTRGLPLNRPIENLDGLYKRRRVTCGETPRYFPEQDNCLHYFDKNSVPPVIGGCQYDMALGNCVDNDAAIFNSYGCASYMEDFVATFVGPQALLLMGSSGMNILSMIISCCMLWKRKNSDVFPDFLHEHLDDEKGKPKRIVVYDRIKDNVKVVPQADILYARGFLPRPGEEVESKEEDGEGEGDIEMAVDDANAAAISKGVEGSAKAGNNGESGSKKSVKPSTSSTPSTKPTTPSTKPVDGSEKDPNIAGSKKSLSKKGDEENV